METKANANVVNANRVRVNSHLALLHGQSVRFRNESETKQTQRSY